MKFDWFDKWCLGLGVLTVIAAVVFLGIVLACLLAMYPVLRYVLAGFIVLPYLLGTLVARTL